MDRAFGPTTVLDEVHGKIVNRAVKLPHLKHQEPAPTVGSQTVGYDLRFGVFRGVVVTHRDQNSSTRSSATVHLSESHADLFIGKQVRNRIVTRDYHVEGLPIA